MGDCPPRKEEKRSAPETGSRKMLTGERHGERPALYRRRHDGSRRCRPRLTWHVRRCLRGRRRGAENGTCSERHGRGRKERCGRGEERRAGRCCRERSAWLITELRASVSVPEPTHRLPRARARVWSCLCELPARARPRPKLNLQLSLLAPDAVWPCDAHPFQST